MKLIKKTGGYPDRLYFEHGIGFYGDVSEKYSDGSNVNEGDSVDIARSTTSIIDGSTYTSSDVITNTLTETEKVAVLPMINIFLIPNNYLTPGETFNMRYGLQINNIHYNFGDTNTFLSINNPILSIQVPKEFIVTKSDVIAAFAATGKTPSVTEVVNFDGNGTKLFTIEFYGTTSSNTGLALNGVSGEDYNEILNSFYQVVIPVTVALDALTGTDNYFEDSYYLGFNANSNHNVEPAPARFTSSRQVDVNDLDQNGLINDYVIRSRQDDLNLQNLSIEKSSIFMTTSAQKSAVDSNYMVYDSNNASSTTNMYTPQLGGTYRLEVLNGGNLDQNDYVAYVEIPKQTGSNEVEFDLVGITGANEFVVEYSTDANPTKNELDDNPSTVDIGYSTTAPADLSDVTMVKLTKSLIPAANGTLFDEVILFNIKASSNNTISEIDKTSEIVTEYASTSNSTRSRYTTQKTVMMLNGYGICGTVFEDSNRNGMKDVEEEKSGVEVQIIDSNDNLIATTTTDVNGEYEFENLLVGRGKVRINHMLASDEKFTHQEKSGVSEVLNSNVDVNGEYAFDIMLIGKIENINAGIAKIAYVDFDSQNATVSMPYDKEVAYEITNYSNDLTISYEELNGNITYVEDNFVNGVGTLDLSGVTAGNTTLKVKVEDADGVVVEDVMNIEVTNNAPVIVASSEMVTVNDTYDPLTTVNVSDVEDDLYGETVLLTVDSNTVDTSTKGKYEVVYKAEDKAGNVVTLSRVVYVIDDNDKINNDVIIMANDFKVDLDDANTYTSGDALVASNVQAYKYSDDTLLLSSDIDVDVDNINDATTVGPVDVTITYGDGSTNVTTVVTASIVDGDTEVNVTNNEAIYALNFEIDIDDVNALDELKVKAFANIYAWDMSDGSEVVVTIDYSEITEAVGVYEVVISTNKGTTKKVYATVFDDSIVIEANNYVVHLDDIINHNPISSAAATAWRVDNGNSMTVVANDNELRNITEIGRYELEFVASNGSEEARIKVYVFVIDDSSIIINGKVLLVDRDRLEIDKEKAFEMTLQDVVEMTNARAYEIATGERLVIYLKDEIHIELVQSGEAGEYILVLKANPEKNITIVVNGNNDNLVATGNIDYLMYILIVIVMLCILKVGVKSFRKKVKINENM